MEWTRFWSFDLVLEYELLLSVAILISSCFFIMKLNVVLDLQLTEDFEEVSVQSRGFGILDVGYRSQVCA